MVTRGSCHCEKRCADSNWSCSRTDRSGSTGCRRSRTGCAPSGLVEAPRELAERLRDLGPGRVVIKLGARGAVGVEGDEICEQPVYPVAAIDTVGAGDAFVAGYLSLWKDDVPVHRRLERATAAGAFACTVVGDWESAPTMAELNRLSDPEGIAR